MHSDKSHVAVITRTQNRPLMLRRALATLSEQTFSDYRVWVINDGGDKECVEQTLSQASLRIRERCTLLHHNAPRGMEAASNTAISASQSKYVVIHDLSLIHISEPTRPY